MCMVILYIQAIFKIRLANNLENFKMNLIVIRVNSPLPKCTH